VIDADHSPAIRLCASGLQDVQVGEREPMVLVIVSQESERGVLVLHFGVEDQPVPAEHLLEAPGAVDDVDEPCGTNALHQFSSILDRVSESETRRPTARAR
jgi:hypothetical protein